MIAGAAATLFSRGGGGGGGPGSSSSVKQEPLCIGIAFAAGAAIPAPADDDAA